MFSQGKLFWRFPQRRFKSSIQQQYIDRGSPLHLVLKDKHAILKNNIQMAFEGRLEQNGVKLEAHRYLVFQYKKGSFHAFSSDDMEFLIETLEDDMLLKILEPLNLHERILLLIWCAGTEKLITEKSYLFNKQYVSAVSRQDELRFLNDIQPSLTLPDYEKFKKFLKLARSELNNMNNKEKSASCIITNYGILNVKKFTKKPYKMDETERKRKFTE